MGLDTGSFLALLDQRRRPSPYSTSEGQEMNAERIGTPISAMSATMTIQRRKRGDIIEPAPA